MLRTSFRTACVSLLFLVFISSPAMAENPVHWVMTDLTVSDGGSAFWTSSTSITPWYPQYDYSYEITQIEAELTLGPLTWWQDVTSEIPLEDRSGSGILLGPCPFTVVDESLTSDYASADVKIEVNAGGYGHTSITNVWLGSYIGADVEQMRLNGYVDLFGGPLDPEYPAIVPHTVYLGDNLQAHTFRVKDENSASWAANMTFSGDDGATIHQIKAFDTVDVHTEVDADAFDAVPEANYDKQEDSWVFTPFGGIGDGIEENPDGSFHVHAGTPGGEEYGSLDFVYVVADGDVSWSGGLARLGVDYDRSGTTFLFLIPGDANNDGMVTDADYTIWADIYGATAPTTWDIGDFNKDGIISDADYTIWADNYTGAGGVAIPEPATLSLLALGGLALLRRK